MAVHAGVPQPVHRLLRLQQTHGNQHVGRLLRQSAGEPHERQAEKVARRVAAGADGPVFRGDPSRTAATAAPAGRQPGGHPVPSSVIDGMERTLQADLGRVRLHTDEQADALSRSLQARAFTVGGDVFFRRGEYDPGRRGGRELLAHELTHTLQPAAATGTEVHRAPAQEHDDTYSDPNIPGATLDLQAGGSSGGGSATYKIRETGVTFTYTPPIGSSKKGKGKSEVYRVDGDVVDPSDLRPTRKRATPDPYFSDYDESDDDSDVEMTEDNQMEMMEDYGRYKFAKLTQNPVRTGTGAIDISHPHTRKAMSAQRAMRDDLPSLLGHMQVLLSLGHQNLRMEPGAGHKVEPGGNSGRPEGVKEPDADYEGLFESMRAMPKKGKTADKNIAALLQLSKATPTDTPTLTDPEIATLALQQMSAGTSKTTARTPLSEHLEKLVAIFAAEGVRAYEADLPFDATLLIKAGLRAVVKRKLTLQQLFYQGKGGVDSVFPGARSMLNSPTEDGKQVGGAAQLRNWRKHRPRYSKNLALFPKNKKKFKHFVRKLRTGAAPMVMPARTPKQIAADAKAEKKARAAEAAALLREVKELVVSEDPTKNAGVIDKLDSIKSRVDRFARRAEAMAGDAAERSALEAQVETILRKITKRRRSLPTRRSGRKR